MLGSVSNTKAGKAAPRLGQGVCPTLSHGAARRWDSESMRRLGPCLRCLTCLTLFGINRGIQKWRMEKAGRGISWRYPRCAGTDGTNATISRVSR